MGDGGSEGNIPFAGDVSSCHIRKPPMKANEQEQWSLPQCWAIVNKAGESQVSNPSTPVNSLSNCPAGTLRDAHPRPVVHHTATVQVKVQHHIRGARIATQNNLQVGGHGRPRARSFSLSSSSYLDKLRIQQDRTMRKRAQVWRVDA